MYAAQTVEVLESKLEKAKESAAEMETQLVEFQTSHQAQLQDLMRTLGHGKDEAGKTGGKSKV